MTHVRIFGRGPGKIGLEDRGRGDGGNKSTGMS